MKRAKAPICHALAEEEMTAQRPFGADCVAGAVPNSASAASNWAKRIGRGAFPDGDAGGERLGEREIAFAELLRPDDGAIETDGEETTVEGLTEMSGEPDAIVGVGLASGELTLTFGVWDDVSGLAEVAAPAAQGHR